MANYAITDYSITSESIETVLENMETHLETRDSTNNPIFGIGILCQETPGGKVTKYTGYIVTKGA